MKNIFKQVTIIIALTLSAVILAHCGAPAGPPAPPVETPSPVVLKLVEFDDLQIDLTQLTGDTAASVSKVVEPGDDVTSFVGRASQRAVATEEQILIPITEGLGAIEIPVSEDIQAFTGEVTFTQLSPFILDTFFGTHNVKLDFRDFDFDGDGATEGCSGHTAALPVCIRFWLDDVRFIAWVFDEYPVEGVTVGKGRYKIVIDNVYGITWEMAIAYEQRVGESEFKGYDASLKGTVTGDPLIYFQNDGNPLEDVRWHLRIGRIGPEGSALKSADTNDVWEMLLGGTTPATTVAKATERFVDGLDFWAGAFFVDGYDEGVPITIGEQDICARTNEPPDPSSYIAVEPTQCEDVGGNNIRIGYDPLFPADGHPFIKAVTDADVAFPPGFPAAPPADFDTLPKP